MDKIILLKPEVYNLIAAGEVVEKPVGAVKELVENSIDAGATRIVVEVSGGGFELISVTDNGSGIDESDLDLAFVKHATSKLSGADELFAVQTLGFRGEALSSIAAISRVRLTTRRRSADTGVCISVEDGAVTNKQYVSANVGTKIEVRDLFYNTPARKKFFKTPGHESTDISKFMARLILTNPNLEISYILDGNLIYETRGNGLEEALFAVYGADCLRNCVKVSFAREGLRIDGYIGIPEYSKTNKSYQTLSVNGRYILDQSINGAIMQAYKSYLMTRKFPFYVLNVDVPFDKIDVNVHPKKLEVRFAEAQRVNGAFYRAVNDALNEYAKHSIDNLLSAQHEVEQSVPQKHDVNEFWEKFNKAVEENDIEQMNPGQREDIIAMEESSERLDDQSFTEVANRLERQITVERARKVIGLDNPSFVRQSSVVIEDLVPDPPLHLTDSEEQELFDRARILGAAFKTYLIVEIDEKVIFVDQHAAHERILFDKFLERETGNMQQLLFPYVFTVTEEESQFIEENRENILAAGIEIEDFGRNTYRIVAVSTLLADTQMKDFVEFLLASIEEFKVDERTLIVEKIAKKACKAAVKAGYRLSEDEIKYILKQIYHNKILQCPHGRPITVVFSKMQIEKMFKRIV
ncbi:MAG: DNA mismatch repair endonuclease MutL [Clostridiales bacterium]|nr:DNA mismatch repair endonuclease MutL [Clostridiales bacterium]